ncbi:Gram-negative bacterial tonB protein [Labrenzia sp. THAF82]|uniref:energy transducer TonB n=1 Tax=Labrenzia sp. THAF82 TaxID=2587861 RepID=UPI0012684216|nr:TonB family protein [Labrenzia sp. THAF82]QFT30358.1 Gram-negative bacterial tonB protein [Labrenzia sp. THAF82]
MKSIHRLFFVAVLLSLAIHVIAAALTMTDAPALKHSGGGAVQHAVLGEAAFNTIVSGSVEQLATTVPVYAIATRKAIKGAISAASNVEAITPLKSETATPVKPSLVATVVPRRQTTVRLPTAQTNALAVTSRALAPEKIARTVGSKAQTPEKNITQVPLIASAASATLKPSHAQPTPVLPNAANTESVTAKPVPANELAAIEAENAPTAEPAETTPSPRIKPKPPVREVDEAVPEKRTKQARKPQSASRNGASGTSSRTAQKGGSQRKSKAKSAGNADATNYPAKVHRKLLRSVRAPRGGKRTQSDAVVRFTVRKNGSVTGIRLAKSSGSKPFDSAVVKAVQRAAPFPPIPGSRASWSFTLPVAMR